MPSISTRGFIVRPTLDNTEPEAEPECESVNVQACTDPYSFISDGVVTLSGWNTPVSLSTVSSRTVEERIKDKMLEKIEEFLESNQLNELSVLAAVYQKFKELHP